MGIKVTAKNIGHDNAHFLMTSGECCDFLLSQLWHIFFLSLKLLTLLRLRCCFSRLLFLLLCSMPVCARLDQLKKDGSFKFFKELEKKGLEIKTREGNNGFSPNRGRRIRRGGLLICLCNIDWTEDTRDWGEWLGLDLTEANGLGSAWHSISVQSRLSSLSQCVFFFLFCPQLWLGQRSLYAPACFFISSLHFTLEVQ